MRRVVPFEIKYYITEGGKEPFWDWFETIKDARTRRIVSDRVYRLQSGNTGDCRSLGGGTHELRIHYGPGLRVYFGKETRVIVVLLCGGEKQTQETDIKQAHAYWKDYHQRTYGNT